MWRLRLAKLLRRMALKLAPEPRDPTSGLPLHVEPYSFHGDPVPEIADTTLDSSQVKDSSS